MGFDGRLNCLEGYGLPGGCISMEHMQQSSGFHSRKQDNLLQVVTFVCTWA